MLSLSSQKVEILSCHHSFSNRMSLPAMVESFWEEFSEKNPRATVLSHSHSYSNEESALALSVVYIEEDIS